MSLLKLCNIGKIYVSGDSVAVGIRGVNLELDIGEFVAITGKSGSGKTTLLNVISGMDTYEEGELYIEGETTSHFDQSDWEEYRQKYISFIFQDYNIIESFTVLQNVELALSDSYAPRDRRKKALELIDRVGLTKFKNHKGSKLSGGQKQRTVIARALAKDSPIILADEPTGNLDSQTSKEIIKLLSEISKEKLVIVVTHNFDEVEQCATREVRIFDGAVDRDEEIREAVKTNYSPKNKFTRERRGNLRQGIELGIFRFFAMPKLSVFTCIIMIIAMLGSFFATSTLFQGSKLFDKNYIMTHMNGRVAVSPQDGSAVSEDKIKALAESVGADSYVVYDKIFESPVYYSHYTANKYYSTEFSFIVDDSINPSVGRRPQAPGEALLYLPIGMQPVFGSKEILVPQIDVCGNGSLYLNVVGIKYYYDNNRPYSNIVLTAEGFSELSKYIYLISGSSVYIDASFGNLTDDTYCKYPYEWNFAIDCSLTGREFYFANCDAEYLEADTYKITYEEARSHGYTDNYQVKIGVHDVIALTPENSTIRYDKPNYGEDKIPTLCISPDIAEELSTGMLADYSQSSLFFKNDKIAEDKLIEIRQNGFNAVASSFAHTSSLERILNIIGIIGTLLLWFGIIVFIAFFLSICTSRAIISKIGDIAILRSMGIKVKIIKIAMYAQTMLAAIPSIIVLIITALVVFLTPSLNPNLPYLYLYEYALIIIGVLLIGFRITRRNNKKMFRGSVRKTLRHDAADEA